ncbi:MAG: hypothetical protein PGN19_10950 [Pseudomonas oryzihabitans]
MSEQRWQRLGPVFVPARQRSWLFSHAANPQAVALAHSDLHRIYFNFRDERGRAGIAWLDWRLATNEVISLCAHPVLLPGDAGRFDEDGVSLGNVVVRDEELWCFYVGWNLSVSVPWRNFIGLARGQPEQPLERAGRVPILDRSEADPFSLSYPWVLWDARQSRWRMWYGSNLAWGAQPESMQHVIKYAESSDGRAWQRSGTAVLPLREGELGLSRPCVLIDPEGRHRLWYAIRSAQGYRLGYAESADGTNWARLDQLINWSGPVEAWEGESQTYPCVFMAEGALYMLYNGHGYGRHGFGLARLEE